MGTNYYLRRIPSQKDADAICELVRRGDILNRNNSDKVTVEDYVGKLSQTYHIGKLSTGWKFVFKEYPGAFDDTRETVYEWIRANSDSYAIETEYGERIDLDDFIDIVERSYSDGTNYDAISYAKEHLGEYNQTTISDYISIDGTWWSSSVFE